MPKLINLKPYRTALEAIVSHNSPAKISAMLGNAVANLDDPQLREELKNCINSLDRYIRLAKSPVRILSESGFTGASAIVSYIEDILDSEETEIWKHIASNNGWVWGDIFDDINSISEEFKRKALIVVPSFALEDMPSSWVVWESDEGPKGRTIMWTCISKDIGEVEGPSMLDCPPFLFELAPTVLNEEWRRRCLDFHNNKRSLDI